jgi:hypothetical protein
MINEAVERFQVNRFLEDIEATGAYWLIFTLGQNTGYYASPNSVIDARVGMEICAQRDLALEIAQGLNRLGKRFIAYLPCEVNANTALHAGFAWNTTAGSNQAEFQRRYTPVVREWSQRFGELCSGWWFDGCYTWDAFHSRYMDWQLWLDAARAGNPAAAVAFNDGSFCVGNLQPVTLQQDYLSGEVEMLHQGRIRLGRGEPFAVHMPEGRFVPKTNCQWHCLLPVDCMWMHGSPVPDYLPGHPYKKINYPDGFGIMEPPLYSNDALGGFLHRCLDNAGAVTFNVGIYQEGHLGRETVRQLKSICLER